MDDAALFDNGLPAWILRARRGCSDDDRLMQAGVTDAQIRRPARRDLRDRHPDHRPGQVAANKLVAPQPGPFSARPERPHGNLSLTALSGFSWGAVLRGSGRGLGRGSMPRVSPDHLVIHVTAGSVRLELPRFDRLLLPGTVTFIPVGTAFSLQHLTEAQGHVLAIPLPLAQRMGTVLPHGIASGRPDPSDEARISAALKRLGEFGPVRGTVLQGLAAHQLNLLSLALSRLDDRPFDRPAHAEDPNAARILCDRFIRLARRKMDSGMTLPELAQELHVTTGALDRATICARGRPVLDLLHDLRRECALDLLRENHLSPAEIAIRVGYVGLSHMKRVFIAETGRVPEDFRGGFRDTPTSQEPC